MKCLMKLTVIITIILGGLLMPSCDPDSEYMFSSSVCGKVVVTPSNVKNGDEIALEIGGLISASGNATINGKELYPIVHYLLDGREIAISSDKDLPFKAKYTINELAVGEHEISVDIVGSQKGAIFENKVVSTKITVVE